MKSKTQSYWVLIGILLFTYLLTSSYVFAAPRKDRDKPEGDEVFIKLEGLRLAQTEEKAFAGALFQMGLKHLRGDGVPQDYKKAADYFLKAAELGDARAQLELSNLYLSG